MRFFATILTGVLLCTSAFAADGISRCAEALDWMKNRPTTSAKKTAADQYVIERTKDGTKLSTEEEIAERVEIEVPSLAARGAYFQHAFAAVLKNRGWGDEKNIAGFLEKFQGAKEDEKLAFAKIVTDQLLRMHNPEALKDAEALRKQYVATETPVEVLGMQIGDVRIEGAYEKFLREWAEFGSSNFEPIDYFIKKSLERPADAKFITLLADLARHTKIVAPSNPKAIDEYLNDANPNFIQSYIARYNSELGFVQVKDIVKKTGIDAKIPLFTKFVDERILAPLARAKVGYIAPLMGELNKAADFLAGDMSPDSDSVFAARALMEFTSREDGVHVDRQCENCTANDPSWELKKVAELAQSMKTIARSTAEKKPFPAEAEAIAREIINSTRAADAIVEKDIEANPEKKILYPESRVTDVIRKNIELAEKMQKLLTDPKQMAFVRIFIIIQEEIAYRRADTGGYEDLDANDADMAFDTSSGMLNKILKLFQPESPKETK